MDRTLAFYHAIGFQNVLDPFHGCDRVVLLKLENLVIEAYEEGNVDAKPGAIDQVCIDVGEIERTWVKEMKFDTPGYRNPASSVLG